MSDKKLDLNKPFLSIRKQQYSSSTVSSERYGVDDKRLNSFGFSTPGLPRYKSELKSGPVRNPGTVPFLWEKTPGQPKVDRKPQVQNQVAPRSPPGRSSMANRIDSHLGNIAECGAAKSLLGSMGLSLKEEMRKSPSSGDCDEVFLDARDNLPISLSGSSYLNCSMSHFTGLDDLDGNDARGNYPTDPKTQELMMERFLPAAKALASEKPKCSLRKLSPREPSQQVKQTVIKPTLRYRPSFTKRYSLFGKDANGEEEEVENKETYYHHNVSMPQGCGMLPSLLKGSLFLSPVPGSSMRIRGSISPAARTKPESSLTRSINQADPSSEADIYNQLFKRISDVPKFQSDSKCRETAGSKTLQDKVSESGSPVGERTVYVDTEQNVGTQSSFSTGSQDSGFVSRDGDEQIATKMVNHMHILDSSSLENIKTITCEDMGTLPSEVSNDPEKLLLRPNTFAKTKEKHTQITGQQSASDPNVSEKPPQRPRIVKKLQKKYSLLPVTPPLPKSPTDPWLFRTLHSMSKKAPAQSFLASATNRQKHGFKVQSHNQELV